MSKKNVSIVLPAFNEEGGIKKTIQSIPKKKLQDLGYEIEIIVVDNNSTDATASVAKELGVIVISQPLQGYGHAYKKGFNSARGDILVACDSDGSYPIEELPVLLESFSENQLDFLTTNRFEEGFSRLSTMPFVNRMGNWMLSVLCKILFMIKIKDSQSGMWIMTKNLWNRLQIRSNQMGFSQELKIEAIVFEKAMWDEVNIAYYERVGKKKLRVVIDGIGNLLNIIAKKIRR